MVELVHAGRSPEELARAFEPSAEAIRNWVDRPGVHDAGGDQLSSAEREEPRRLAGGLLPQEENCNLLWHRVDLPFVFAVLVSLVGAIVMQLVL
ncbi:MAG TPA: hypothetical protein VFZ10_07880 [Geminicoccaceae bacterium]